MKAARRHSETPGRDCAAMCRTGGIVFALQVSVLQLPEKVLFPRLQPRPTPWVFEPAEVVIPIGMDLRLDRRGLPESLASLVATLPLIALLQCQAAFTTF